MDELTYNIIVNFIVLLGYVYLISKQWLEILRLPDEILVVRWLVFLIYLIALITLVPVTVNQVLNYLGIPSEFLTQLAIVLSPTNRLSTLILLIGLANVRIKEIK